jgi:predicted ATPase
MRITSEKPYRLPPLPVPMEVVGITASEAICYPSVQLFVERVAALIDDYTFTDVDAPLVANVCRRLDGIALAIELAAGRVEAFGVQGVADQLHDRLDLLARGHRSAIPRHQTLATAIGWSYDALSDEERFVLQRLSIFPSGFTLRSALEICQEPQRATDRAVDVISSLVGKSLISVNTERLRTEYRLLDTTRVYARKKLSDSGHYQTVSSRYAYHVRMTLEAAVDAGNDADLRWPVDYGGQIDDLRAALAWSLGPGGDVNIAVALIVVSMPLWIHLSLVQECRTYVARALERPEADIGPDGRMALYAALAMSQMYIGSDMRELDAAWSQVLSLSSEIGDEKYRARAIWGMSSCHLLYGKVESARRFANQYLQLSELGGNAGARHIAERLIGQASFYLGDFANAREHLEAVAYRFTASAEKLHVLDQRVMAQSYLTQLLWITGYPDAGRRLMNETLKYARETGHALSICWALSQSACHLLRWLKEGDLFVEGVEDLVARSQRYRLAFMQAPGRCYAGQLLVERGAVVDGLVCFQEGFDEFRRNSIGLYRDILCDLALSLCQKGDFWKANLAIDEAMSHFEQNGELWYYPESLRIKGEIKLAERKQDEAIGWFRKGLAAASRMGALSWELRIAISLARLEQPRPDAMEAAERLAAVYDRFSEGFESADLKEAEALIQRRDAGSAVRRRHG